MSQGKIDGDYDIVLPYKNFGDTEELRYTLRSICKNLPHRNVVISGDLPDWAVNVVHVDHKKYDWAVMGNRFLNAEAKWVAACEDPRVSDDFYCFNDDFFVMKFHETIPVLHRGKLPTNDYTSQYKSMLTKTGNFIRELNISPAINYGLHVPMPMNKHKRLALNYLVQGNIKRGNVYAMRALYGSMYRIGGKEMVDIKNIDDFTDKPFLSSTQGSFAKTPMGAYIREQFPDPCYYEK